jgi:hypothetical protein
MFFQEVTPDTSGYMIAGFVISFVVMGVYVASLYLRSRSLKQDKKLLEEIDEATPNAAKPEHAADRVAPKSTQL